MSTESFVPLTTYTRYTEAEMLHRSEVFYDLMKRRRTVREFSSEPIPREVIDFCVQTAGTSPSGANMQPWHFVVITDSEMKRKIREAAESVEHDFYNKRAPAYWLEALSPLGTDEHKPCIEEAPCLIAIFTRLHTVREDGSIAKHYYLAESTGIAAGILVTALHNAGLAMVTYTPSQMGFLREMLGRPKIETPYMLLVVGYPKEGTKVPDISKLPLDKIMTRI